MDITDYAGILRGLAESTFYTSDRRTLIMVADAIVRQMEEEEKDFDREGFLDLCGLDPKPDERKYEE